MTDLLKEIENIKKVSSQNDKNSKASSAIDSKLIKDIEHDASVIRSIISGLYWFLENIAWPIVKWIIVKPAIKYYKFVEWLLGKFALDENRFLGVKKTRSGIIIAFAIGFLFIIPTILEFIYDSGLYLVTSQHREEIYLHNAQEIYPNDDIWSVQGCESLPCNDQNSLNFRIKPTLFNHMWSIAHNNYNLVEYFYPDYVAAAVPPIPSLCSITSYGVRIKFLMKNMDVYPYLLNASCQPINKR